ncbi:hypothetical protein F5B22DRAFT_502405 [Xylaria bambusicola]|uniref:uncharacterized protein n=1 Tax=Xylaria bambusicola TaxID=326684 RepID=UPI002007F7E2|nr:uncharacterized protein F5B22DRAFT_502405 [Xylaria bambusicola]KAI0521791.1 hypothetical protein F5B22DRAFT_502405 [Xylaria bambusicola]
MAALGRTSYNTAFDPTLRPGSRRIERRDYCPTRSHSRIRYLWRSTLPTLPTLHVGGRGLAVCVPWPSLAITTRCQGRNQGACFNATHLHVRHNRLHRVRVGQTMWVISNGFAGLSPMEPQHPAGSLVLPWADTKYGWLRYCIGLCNTGHAAR